MVAAFDASNKDALRPALALGKDVAYIASPTTGEILTVNLADLKVPGNASLIALVEAHGTKHERGTPADHR